jgi:hypothetical protein
MFHLMELVESQLFKLTLTSGFSFVTSVKGINLRGYIC